MASESIRCSPDFGYVYLNNAKAGCSTIKYALWMQALERGIVPGPPEGLALHGRGFWQIDTAALREAERDFFIFSFARNPYTRLLSCYRDKIARKGHIRTRFCIQHGLPLKDKISFSDFVRRVCDTSPYESDQHWRPQHLNMLAGYLPIAFVGHLETLAEDFAVIRDRVGTRLSTARTGHATSAGSHLDTYDDETIELVRRTYALDFELFGYSTDIAHTDPLSGPVALDRCLPTREALLQTIYEPDPARAIAIAEAALAGASDDMLELRLLYLKLRSGQDVGNKLRQVARQWPDDELVIDMQRLAARNVGKPSADRRLLKRLVELFPHRAAYRTELALELLELGRPKPALKEATVARQLRPHSPGTAEVLARVTAAMPSLPTNAS